ncbi:MAG: 50S ribosomal protein L11 methyltransferase [Bacillota bacterium]
MMKYIEVQVVTTTEASDAISEIMYNLEAAGVVIEDPNDFKMHNRDEKSWDYVEEELVAKLGEDVKVKGYFSELLYNEGILSEIKSRLDEFEGFGLDKGKGEVTTREVYEEDWANAWKQYYKPVRIADKVVIKPTWEQYEADPDEVIIELDPGMAFGTGTHETTIMCIKLIEKHLKEDAAVFDVGCGSGILGITAAKLNAKKVICVDIDGVSCKVSKENAELNKVSDKVEIRCGNLLDVVNEKADMIVANIIADIIISFSEDAYKFMKNDAVFISSGIIKDRRDEVLEKLNKEGYKVLELLEMGEWCAIAAKSERNA